MKDEALKLALEALQKIYIAPEHEEYIRVWWPACEQAIPAIKEALAQPEYEPLEYWNAVEGWVKIDEVREHFDSVGCGTIYKTAGEGREPLYTTPPQRKPLSDEQIILIVAECASSHQHTDIHFARAIEAAIWEKQK